MTDQAFLTLAEFSRLHGVKKPTVTGWRRRGYLVFAADGKRVDVAASNARLAARPSIHRGGPVKVLPGKSADQPDKPDGDPDAVWSLHEATRRERVAAARLRELQLAREAGQVASIEEIAEKVGKRFSVVRSRMLALSPALAPRLAVLNTAEECGRLLDDAIRAALTELATIP